MENKAHTNRMQIGACQILIQFKLFAFIIFCLFSLFACGGGGGTDGIPPPPPEDTGAQKNIGPAGGTVEVTNQNSSIYGAKIDIPAGALSTNVDIGISISSSQPSLPNSNYTRLDQMKETIQLSPSGLKFNKPVTITLQYDPSINENIDTVIVGMYDETLNVWDIPTLLNLDATKKEVTFLTNHFSKADKLKRKADIPITTNPIFNFSTDTFSITNTREDLSGTSCDPNGACAGFFIYGKWYFENKRSIRNLIDAYNQETEKRIVCEAEAVPPGLSLMDEIIIYVTQNDTKTAENLKAALTIKKTPQWLGWSAESKLHVVMVYSWDPTQNCFNAYDPNKTDYEGNLIPRQIYLIDVQLRSVDNVSYYLYLDEKLYKDDTKMQTIYDKYPFDKIQGYSLRYSNDFFSDPFSSDPPWTTNNPNRFYRDPTTNTFYAITVEGANEYATVPVNWAGNSFKIEFDIKIASSQRASGISIGLFDADRHDALPNVVDVKFGYSDDGLHVNLHAANSTTSKGAPSTIQNIQTNVWYHNIISWDKDTGIVKLELTNRDTGVAIGTYTIDGFTSFPTEMKNLGISWVGHNASTNRTTSYIDNIKFYEK